MDVMKPSGSGLYLLSYTAAPAKLPYEVTNIVIANVGAWCAQCDLVVWHKRPDHLTMQSVHAQHANDVPFAPEIPRHISRCKTIRRY
jgi:hypothetical protein